MKQWRCTICGYITDVKVDKCPICSATWDKFEEF